MSIIIRRKGAYIPINKFRGFTHKFGKDNETRIEAIAIVNGFVIEDEKITPSYSEYLFKRKEEDGETK